MSIKKTSLITAIIAILAAIIVIFLGIYTYIIEMTEIGSQYLSVVYTNLTAGALTGVVIFLFTALFTLLWCIWIRKNLQKATLAESVFEKNAVVTLICLGAGLLATVLFTADCYKNLLMASNAVSSGTTDPLFGKDISYYMLVRPFLVTLRDKANLIFMALLVFSAVSYYIYLTKNGLSIKNALKEKGMLAQLSVNIGIIFLIKIAGYRFNMENILFEGTERTGGGFTSVAVWLNFYRIMPFVLFGIIVLSAFFLIKSKYRLLIATVAVYPLCFVIATVASFAVQQLYVKPNEGATESKYIGYNIQATRQAYNIDNSTDSIYPVSDSLNADILAENKDIIDNIRITDHEATLTAYNQLQGIRNFYQFLDADIVPYTENGQRKAAFISVRELSQVGDLEDATYVNKRMKYTHGYGIVKSPVNRVANEGQPDFIIKDIPLSYKDTDAKVSQPRIYFGEASNDYFIVNTAQSELDFDETSDEHIGYSGTAGIKMSTLNRLVYAIKQGDINLLTSSYITGDSRLLLNHNVVERIKKAAPFLTVDDDVHIAIDSDGSLKWIADCYTWSGNYPYSQYTQNSNYIRNSAKAVVDAYNGTVTLYIIDPSDPIIQTYEKIYPEVFSGSPMPDALRQQIKYPEWLFNVQAKIFTQYHITDPATFYAGSDVWAIAREKYGEDAAITNVEPYYNIVSLGEGEPEFVLMLPYTLKNKDNNLVGWLAARTDGDNYGKFISYSFPAGKHVYGTLQVENKIDNDPDISKEITLWSQGGSSVMRGNMLVVPIKNSLVYVEPLYITSQNEASLPEVKRIIVCYGDKIVMESSLDEAFAKLFGVFEAPPVVPDVPEVSDDTLSQLKSAYSALKQAASSGDWESFGKSMQTIEELLQ